MLRTNEKSQVVTGAPGRKQENKTMRSEEIACAADALVGRCDEIVTACEDRPEELFEIFSRKGIHLSSDICMGFAAAIARTETSEDLRQSAAAIQRLRETDFSAILQPDEQPTNRGMRLRQPAVTGINESRS